MEKVNKGDSFELLHAKKLVVKWIQANLQLEIRLSYKYINVRYCWMFIEYIYNLDGFFACCLLLLYNNLL